MSRETHTAQGRGEPVLGEREQALLTRVWDAERRAAATLPSDDSLDSERRRRTDATWPELVAQPEVIERNWNTNADALARAAEAVVARNPDRIIITGAGDSLAVATAARLAFETLCGVPCEPVQSMELAYYLAGGITPRSVVIALSSSGETTRTVHAMLVGKAAGALTLALTNRIGSTLDVECDNTLLVGATRVGWPTQSSTAPLALLLRLAGLVGAARGTIGAAELLSELNGMPELMRITIDRAHPAVAEQARSERAGHMYLFSGAGPNLASAVVGAAKVKETTPDHAVAVQLEEFHHYNSIKAGEPLWMFAPTGPVTTRAVDTIHEAHRLGGHVHAVTTDGNRSFDGLARTVLHLPVVSEALSPLLYFIPAQLVGYHLGAAKFAAADV